MTEALLDYVARLPCGCCVGWISAQQDPKQLAKDIADFIRRGCSIERMSTEHAKSALRRCIHTSARADTGDQGELFDD